ncbi:MAG TPA: acyl carrier protein [Kofleriaceae bacterium]|nr:acyl carrier protein [Kofleriaceae bacterium]
MSIDSRPALRAFISDLAVGAMFTDDVDLVKEGIVSSLQLMELIAFLEDRFGVVVTAVDLHNARLASVATMAALIEEFS